jgi:membrane-bound serine protease (ClpP class)
VPGRAGLERLRGRRRRQLAVAVALGGLLAATWVLPLRGAATARTGAAVVPIRGEISDVMLDSVRRRVEAARAAGATTIIFELHTPGGLVTSALEICRLIKNLPQELHTVAWVNTNAYSAGAMIAVACQQIVMSPSSSIGDCAPIMVRPTGGLEDLPPAERAKAESPVLQEFRDSAARNGYDPLLLRAMVSVGEEVWWVENTQTGQRRFVTADEKRELLGQTMPFSGPSETGIWRLVKSYVHPQTGREVPAKQPVDSANELLTLSQDEAVAYGLASGIAGDLVSLAERLGLDSAPTYLEITGWEKFVMWLNSPLVRGVLFVLVLIGAYIEFQSPGLILPGVTAAVALAIFLAAPYAAGLASIWTFVLLGVGVILLAIEIFIIPGFGIVGLLGIACILVALIGTFVPGEPASEPGQLPLFSWPKLPATWQAIKYGITVLSASIIVAFVGILLLVRYLPQLSLGRRLIPVNPVGTTLAVPDAHPGVALVGDIGVVTADLRPGGQARFGQEIVDVCSQGEYVEAGRKVQVIRREGLRIVVRPLPNEPQS